MEDRTAISRLRQGDLHGLEILVNRYQARAVHAAYMIVWDRFLAEDIAQAAFIKTAEKIEQFDDQRPFAPWFFRIVVHEAIKAAKRQKRSVPFNEDALRFADRLIQPSQRPDELVEQKETREVLRNAIQSLAPEQRAVVVMRYFLEMSEAEMSLEMQRPLSTVKWWLREARKRLRGLIGPIGGVEHE